MTSPSLRYHRWARGDWQLLPWILGWSALLGKTRHLPAKMPASGRWKMVDNLRRSVTPLTCVLALARGLGAAVRCGAGVDSASSWGRSRFRACRRCWRRAAARHPGIRARSHFARVVSDLGGALLQAPAHPDAPRAPGLADGRRGRPNAVSTVHHAAAISCNGRRRRRRRSAPIPRLGTYYRWMAGAVVTGVAALAGTWLFGDRTVYLAAPFALLWIASPAVAHRVSRRSSAVAEHAASEADRRALRLIARRTWRYFETFVTAADNMLPPDNFQEDPSPVVARRTSPTNLGLYLLSTASAHDFGWTGALDTVERLEATMAAMAQARAISRPFLQLVRYGDSARRSTRNMSPRSTAAISPAI